MKRQVTTPVLLSSAAMTRTIKFRAALASISVVHSVKPAGAGITTSSPKLMMPSWKVSRLSFVASSWSVMTTSCAAGPRQRRMQRLRRQLHVQRGNSGIKCITRGS